MKSTAGLLFVLAVLFAGLAFGQTNPNNNPNVLVTATLDHTGPMGFDEHTVISCRGIPTCTGTFTSTTRYELCTNYFTTSGAFVLTGMNLFQSGAIQGTLTTTDTDVVRPPGGICQPSTATKTTQHTYTGTWNLATGTGVLNVVNTTNSADNFTLPFKADITAPPPVFEMTVQKRIDPVSATVSANIQFRPQDVGRSGGVYTFASAPAPQVHGVTSKSVHLGMSKADPPAPCVLAQMSGGQLVAVSAASLQAFVTGAFTAAGAAVSILNNTPTPAIAGATFYVGYGSSSSSMLSEGIFRNAALIPGNSICPPLPYATALWWNPAESGWGLNLNHQGTLMFGTLFTYDSARQPLWLVMSAGAMQSDGVTFSGDLYRTTGPAFNANPFTPIGPSNVTRVGDMSISLTEGNAATLRYTMNGTTVEKSIQRQVYGSRAAVCLPTTDNRVALNNYQDLWFIPAESGWGINITHQDNTLFATLFTYDTTGRGVWLVMSNGARQGDGSYFGELYRANGSPFNAVPFTPLAASDVTNVGNMRLRFIDGNNGTLTYTFNGVTVTKAIIRQVFSTPFSTCN